MCIAAPGKVISIKNNVASILYPGVRGRTAIIANIVPKIGDYVLVQMGIVIKILSPEEAKQSMDAWSEIS